MKKSWIHQGTVLIRVGTHHIAFLRGYLEGLDLAVLSSRYLETAVAPDPDLRVAKSTLTWIREQLLVLARRSDRFAEARLLMIDPDRLRAVRQGRQLTLEQFREDRDPYEVFTESELVVLYQEEFGPTGAKVDRRVERNQRLRRKQLAALVALEQAIDARPALSDPIAGWIDPALSGRLAAAGIGTLADLVGAINEKGYRWWAAVPRFGEKAAAQVVAWLKTEPVEAALGIRLGPQATVKDRQMPTALLEHRRARTTGIVPFEFLLVPAELDGSAGENRGERCKIRAGNDYEAVQEWLSLKPSESHTWRSYRKEAERFLLWAIVERRQPLSSLSSDDCVAYRDFLWHLDAGKGGDWPFALPRDAWFGKRGARRWSASWRPFERPLSEQSQNLAITIVDSMCRWLTNRRYLDSNPWDGVPSRVVAEPKVDATRSFTAFQWGCLMNFLDRTADEGRRARLRFVLMLGYATGLRLSEMVDARVGDLERVRRVENQSLDRWVLNVVGKGRRRRQVPFPSRLLSELDSYLRQRGLADRSRCDAGVPLIGRLREHAASNGSAAAELLKIADFSIPEEQVRQEIEHGQHRGVSRELLYKMLKEFFTNAADAVCQAADGLGNLAGSAGSSNAMDEEQAIGLHEMARHIRRASTHWLRHTCGTHAVARGVKLETVQRNFGHASIDTTTIYIEPDTAQRVEEMENFLESWWVKAGGTETL